MRKRSVARERALQILFQTHFENYDVRAFQYTLEEFNEDADKEISDFCKMLVSGVMDNKDVLDSLISKALTVMNLETLSLVDRTLLRMGLFEIITISDIDKIVTINEIVRLSKIYSDQNNYKLINGLLDKFSKTGDLLTLNEKLKN